MAIMLKKLTFIWFLTYLATPSQGSDFIDQNDLISIQKLSAFTSSHQTINLLGGKDVHQFNSHIKPLAPILKHFNHKLKMEPAVEPKEILTKLQEMRVAYQMDPSSDMEIVRLRGYLDQRLDYDKETDMHMTELLKGVWGYITWFQYLQEERNVDTRVLLDELFFYLNQNSAEAGGCFPGYAGRLMLLNARLILEFHNTYSICPELIYDMFLEWAGEKTCI